MEDLVFSLLTLVMQWFRPRYNAHLQLLQAQIRILRSRMDVSRIIPTPNEKAELLRLGALVGHDVAEVMHVVRPETYQKWVRQSRRGIAFKPSGRPRIPMATVNLVLRMAEENVRWDYRRIVGEFKKLGIRIGSTTVKQILRGPGVHPTPDKAFKKPAVPWTTFVHAHMDSMVGTDFFTKRIYTLRGVLTALYWACIRISRSLDIAVFPVYDLSAGAGSPEVAHSSSAMFTHSCVNSRSFQQLALTSLSRRGRYSRP